MADRTREKKDGFGGPVRLAASALLALGLVVLPAAGQDRPADQASWQKDVDYRGLPSESMAVALSVIGTAAAVASLYSHNGWVALAGLSLGPSLGFMYGDCLGRGLLTSGLRLGATIAAVLYSVEHDEAGPGLGYAWIGGMALSAIIDIATVGKAVRKHNDRLLARRGMSVGVAPFALPKGAGVQVRLSF